MGSAGGTGPSGVAARARGDDPGHLTWFLTPAPRHLSWTHSQHSQPRNSVLLSRGLRGSSCCYLPVRAELWSPRLPSAALCPSCTVLVSCCRAQRASASVPSDGFLNTLALSSLHPQVPRDNTKIFSVFHHSCLESGDTILSLFCLEVRHTITPVSGMFIPVACLLSSAVHQGRHRAGLQCLDVCSVLGVHVCEATDTERALATCHFVALVLGDRGDSLISCFHHGERDELKELVAFQTLRSGWKQNVPN